MAGSEGSSSSRTNRGGYSELERNLELVPEEELTRGLRDRTRQLAEAQLTAVTESVESHMSEATDFHLDRKSKKFEAPQRWRRTFGPLIRDATVTIEQFPDETSLTARISEVVESAVRCLDARGFQGSLKTIGSTYDKTRVSADTDLDYLYVLDSTPDFPAEQLRNISVIIERSSGYHGYIGEAFIGNIQVKSLELYKSFSDELRGVFEGGEVQAVQDPLAFGGFAHPHFSGVRFNEPAVTLLFRYNTEKNTYKDISVDITIALRIPDTLVNEREQDLLARCRQIPGITLTLTDLKEGCHLVPVWPYKDKWYLTTAVLEQTLFEQLRDFEGRDHPVRAAIKQCKAKAKSVSRDIDAFYQSDSCRDRGFEAQPVRDLQDWIDETVELYREYRDPRRYPDVDPKKLMECENVLKNLFAVGHTLLFREDRLPSGETRDKRIVSFNSSAFKYIALSCCGDESNDSLTDDVLRRFIDDPEPIKHHFLNYAVRPVVVHYAVFEKLDELIEKWLEELKNPLNN